MQVSNSKVLDLIHVIQSVEDTKDKGCIVEFGDVFSGTYVVLYT